MAKKSQHQKRRTSRPRKASASTGSTARSFIRSLVVGFSASFAAASLWLNPQWRDQVNLDTLLSRLEFPIQARPQDPAALPGSVFQTRFGQCPQFFPGGVFPSVPAGPALRELCFSSFAILYSGHTKTPVFVAQRMNRQMISAGQGVRRTDRFYEESRLPASERASLDDYRGSGYSRGHMAPAGDMDSEEAMAQSFSLANIVPQDQRQNAGAWNKIEGDTRKYIMRAKGDVFVFTGPVYSGQPERIGRGGVAVPSHLFKLVHDPATGRSWAYWQPNSPDARPGPPISNEELTQRTGLKLLQ